jgi:hypothetical protein
MRVTKTFLLAGLCTLAVGAVAPAAGAAMTLTVTKTADTNDGSCTVANCSFRDALGVAQNDDTIVVPAGTYKGSMLGGNGVWSPSGQYSIVGAGAGKTIIDGNHLSRVFAFYGQITMRGVTVTGGQAPPAGCSCGGGFEVRQGGFLTLENSVVQGNSADGGGGIDVDSQSRAILTNVLVSQNSSTAPGGGIHVGPASGSTGTLAMTNVTISGNTTASGALGAGLANEGSTTATNVTFSGNASAADGGGIFNQTTGTLALNGVTLAGNLAPGLGAGIRNLAAAGKLTLRNTIVGDNAAGDCSGTASPVVTSQGHNLALGTSCALTGPGDLPSTDPKLGPLADNGGNGLLTHALPAGSAAIDAGDNAACIATDARGLGRPAGASCDIGAFEYQPPTNAGTTAPPPATGGDSPAPPPPAPPAAGRAVLTLLAKSLKVDAKGIGSIKGACGNAIGDSCRVAGKLQITVKDRKGRKRLKTIGTISGTLAGGTTGKLNVKLNRDGRRGVARSLTVKLVATSANSAGAKESLKGSLKVSRRSG